MSTKGRPKINEKKKKIAHIFVNLTKEQKEKLEKIAQEEDVSLSKLCIKALKELRYI